MKNFLFLISFLLFAFGAQAQGDVKTETFNVEGNCGMCKKRIEKAAGIKGVKRAEWDKETHKMTVVYNASKTSADAIQKSIADAGHSTEKVQASDEAYAKLPQCCQYKNHTDNH